MNEIHILVIGPMLPENPSYYYTEPGEPVLTTLCRYIDHVVTDGDTKISDIRLLLPTLFAKRVFQQEFLLYADGRPQILPKIYAFADKKNDHLRVEAALNAFRDRSGRGASKTEVSALARQMIFVAMIKHARLFQNTEFENMDSWIALSSGLSSLIDTMILECMDPKEVLEHLAKLSEQSARHTNDLIKFLKIAFDTWPIFLDSHQLVDEQQKIVDNQVELGEMIKRLPQDIPVILAGSTGVSPTLRQLMQSVLKKPLGTVILPGFDPYSAADEQLRETIQNEVSHPQYALTNVVRTFAGFARPSNLEENMCLSRFDVCSDEKTTSQRGRDSISKHLLSLALLPQSETHSWRSRIKDLKESSAAKPSPPIDYIAADNPDQEARLVVLATKRFLSQNPKAKILICVTDTTLKHQIVSAFSRWGVALTDSHELKIGEHPKGKLIRLILRFIESPEDALNLTSLLKNIHFLGGSFNGVYYRAVCQFETKYLRSVHHANAIDQFLANTKFENDGSQNLLVEVVTALKALRDQSSKWRSVDDESSISTFVEQMINIVNSLYPDLSFWTDDVGQKLSLILEELKLDDSQILKVRLSQFKRLVDFCLHSQSTRSQSKLDGQIRILDPRNGRFISADLTILAGLNDGLWPSQHTTENFIGPNVRKHLQFPSIEKLLGPAAHDFQQLINRENVILTYSNAIDSVPVMPSRWVRRIEAVDSIARRELDIVLFEKISAYEEIDQGLDLSEPTYQERQDWAKSAKPMPRPANQVKPRKIAVTNLELLMRDPYGFYARRILGLKKLEPLGKKPGPAEHGSALHSAIEKWIEQNFSVRNDDGKAFKTIIALLRRELRSAGFEFHDIESMTQRKSKSLHAFTEWQLNRHGMVSFSEKAGQLDFASPDSSEQITMTARADRLDYDPQTGQWDIIDFKTSAQHKTLAQAKSGFAPQLPMEALILRSGGFDDIGDHNQSAVRSLIYWHLGGNAQDGCYDLLGRESDPELFYAQVFSRLKSFFFDWYLAETTFFLSQPRVQFAFKHESDFDLLARRKEWVSLLGDED